MGMGNNCLSNPLGEMGEDKQRQEKVVLASASVHFSGGMRTL